MSRIYLDIWSTSEFYPLGWDVLLVHTANGTYCLTDGQRVGPAYDDAEEALLDRTTFRRLQFGEELKGLLFPRKAEDHDRN